MSRRVKVEPPVVRPLLVSTGRSFFLLNPSTREWLNVSWSRWCPPPPSLHLHLLYSTFLPFHIHAPSPSFSPFFFSFPSTSFISLVPLFFPPDDAFHSSGFVRHLPLCFTASCFHFLLFPFSSRTSFLPPFFFLIPLQITSRAAAPVRRQYRQMRTFPLIISLMQSALTKRRISNNYSWNDIKGWALLFFFFLSHL